MSRKKCKRKVWSLVNPIQHAMDGAGLIPTSMLNKLHMRELASLDALTQGRGRMDEWSDMVNVNNLAQTLAGMGVGLHEVMPVCTAADDVLIEAAERYQRTKRMGLSGNGIKILRDVIEYHHLQRSGIPRSQYEEAIRLTGARIKSGHATVDLFEKLGPPV